MSAETPKTCSPEEVRSRLAADPPAVLVDVREYPEYAAAHIRGAKVIPSGELKRRAEELPRDREIITVCRSGRRSADAAKTLESLGFSNVAQLEGGVIAWEKAGLPLEREPRAPWALERQVRLVAGLLTLVGLALSHIWAPAIVLAWFIPLGLVFAALTDSCAMGTLLGKMPWNRPSKCSGSSQAGE